MKNILKTKLNNSKGSALVTLLIFTAIGIMVTGAAVISAVINAQNIQSFSRGEETYYGADAGIELAVIKLLRDPSYSGETITAGSVSTTIAVTGTTTKTITATSTYGVTQRKVQATADTSGNKVVITNWAEID